MTGHWTRKRVVVVSSQVSGPNKLSLVLRTGEDPDSNLRQVTDYSARDFTGFSPFLRAYVGIVFKSGHDSLFAYLLPLFFFISLSFQATV